MIYRVKYYFRANIAITLHHKMIASGNDDFTVLIKKLVETKIISVKPSFPLAIIF